MRKLVILVVALGLLGPAEVSAQVRRSVWGISGGFAPTWKVPEEFKVVFGLDVEQVDMAGSEFRIGFVRGQMLSGDWGVSYVHKKLKKESTLVLEGDVIHTTTSSTVMRGVEAHRFISFGTIKDRIQIGLNLGIGAGWFRGEVLKTMPTGEVETVKASELFVPRDKGVPMPIGKVEFAVAGLLAPGLKVRATAGLNFPGYNAFSLSAVYLFGAL